MNEFKLTERCQQLGAALAVLHLQVVVALLLGPRGPLLLQGGQLGHVAAQVDVQQRHQLLAEGAAQLWVGVRVNRAQDDLVLAGDDGPNAADASWRCRREDQSGFIPLHVRRLQSDFSITFVEIRQRATGSSGINNRHHLQCLHGWQQYIFWYLMQKTRYLQRLHTKCVSQ